jgi:hypothetical protein
LNNKGAFKVTVNNRVLHKALGKMMLGKNSLDEGNWNNLIKATDKMLARRADTRARADFATWSMMGKLNGASSLSAEAQDFLGKYKAFLKNMAEGEATEATIALITQSYYAEMGGVGVPPAVTPGPHDAPDEPVTGNVTAFRRPRVQPAKNAGASATKQKLPVGLIFAGLVVIYIGLRYFLG